jgi:CHASE3 domain sensor protein
MKSKCQIAALAMLVLLAGCSRSDQASRETTKDTPATATDVKERYREAATATKSYVAENKDEFISAMNAKLKELDGKISELGKKSENFKDDAKIQSDKALAALREQRKTVNEKFEEVKKSSAETWEEVKAGFTSALAGLEKAFENAKSKFD